MATDPRVSLDIRVESRAFPFPLVQWEPECRCFHGPECHTARIVGGDTVVGCELCGCPGFLHELT